MTFDQACTALRAQLASGFTAVPVMWANEAPPSLPWPPIDADGPAAWAYAEFRGGIGEQISIGAPGENDHEELGALLVHVHTPLQGGDAKARQHADTIVALFRGQEIGGVEITGTLRDEGGQAETDAPAQAATWWRRIVRIEFAFEAVG